MAEQDEVQIRIGISNKGVKKVKEEQKKISQKTVKAKVEIQTIDKKVEQTRMLMQQMQRQLLTVGATIVVYSSMTEAINGLMPNQDHNAYSAFAQAGSGTVMGLLFGGKAGAFMGLLAGTIAIVQGEVNSIREEIKALEDEAKELRDFDDKVQQDLKEFERTFIIDIRKDIKALKLEFYIDSHQGRAF